MNTQKNNRKQQARILRYTRKIHRITGISLFAFFFIVSISALLLGWKKDSGGILLPETVQGSSADFQEWLPLDSLNAIASSTLKNRLKLDRAYSVDRMDIRKSDGIVKFAYKEEYLGLQIDGATGKVLQFGPRRSDLIEGIHDGSIVDDYLGLGGIFKLVYTTVMSLALFLFTLTGFWLWLGPKQMKKRKGRP